jgi:hypothetical protein
MNLYAHVMPSTLRDAAAVIDRALGNHWGVAVTSAVKAGSATAGTCSTPSD